MENKSIQVPPVPVTPQKPKMTTAGKAFLTVGIVAIIAVFVFTGIKGLPYLKKVWGNVSAAAVSLSGIFKPVEKLVVTPDLKEIKSGEIVTLSINHIGQSTGAVALEYECADGVRLQSGPISVTDTIPCGTPFGITNTKSGVPLTAVLTKNGTVTVPVTVTFTKEGASKPMLSSTASFDITTNGKKATSTSSTSTNNQSATMTPSPKPVTPSVQATPTAPAQTAGPRTEGTYVIGESQTATPVMSGKADLAVKILDWGTIDKVTNVYTASTTLRSTDRIAVRFEVVNLGTKETDSWFFNAVLPTYPSHIFTSPSEPSLAPNDRIEFTIGFDSVEKKDNNTVVINADPARSLNEVSEDNNIARVTINGVIFPN